MYLTSNKLVSHHFDVLHPIIKEIWLLVEWKVFVTESPCIFHNGTMLFLLLESYLAIIFFYVDINCLPKESGLPQI